MLKLQELERQKNVNWNREEEQNSRDQRIANSCNYQIYEVCVFFALFIFSLCTFVKYFTLQEPLIEIKRPVHEANPTSDSMLLQQQWTGRSLQDVTQETNVAKSEYRQPSNTHDYRSSMPNIQQELIVSSPYHRVPPPIPPNKPAHFREPAPVNKCVIVYYQFFSLFKKKFRKKNFQVIFIISIIEFPIHSRCQDKLYKP